MTTWQPAPTLHTCTDAPCHCWDWAAVQHDIPPLPHAKMLYDKWTPLEMCEPNGIDRGDFPQLVGRWEVPIVRGRE